MESKELAEQEDAARWRFGEVVLDERTMELLVAGTKAELTRKPLELLMYLVRNPGEVVTKDELIEAVWPGRVVSESSLTNAMARLRAALGDERAQQLIKSVYGYGYRFMGEVVREAARSTPLPRPEPALDFKDGDSVPLRTGWLLRRRLGAGGGGDAWLATEAATHDVRVFKFARDRAALTALKREITLSRLMRESLGERPDFVRVLDWSLDEAPYFIAVDHCSEGSLADWAEANGGIGTLPLAQRLELLAQAAEALAAAHSVGVLHKDLKPSNLLLHKSGSNGALQIRLSDFGSARLIDRGRLTSLNIAQLGFTQTVFIDGSTGTPLYLAPELLDGHQPTIRSDVYALGVVLYQLAVGDLRRPLAPGWELKVEDPLLIQDIAAAAAGDPQHRLVDAAEVATRLRSLPQRREAMARELAQRQEAELTRVALERVRARRSLWMALACVAVVGMAVSFWQFLNARAAVKRAEAAAAESAAVSNFLVNDLLRAAHLFGGQSGGDLTVRSMLDRAAGRIASRLQGQSRVRARIEMSLADAYESAGSRDAEIHMLELAVKDAEAAEGPDGVTTLDAMLSLANTDYGPANYDRNERYFRRVLANAARLGDNHQLVLNAGIGLALLEYQQARYAESARNLETLVARARAAGIAGMVAETDRLRVEVLNALGRYTEAESVARMAIQEESAHTGPESARTNRVRVGLGNVLINQGKFAEARPVLEHARDGLSAVLGPVHVFTVLADYDLGKLRLLSGDAIGALPILERVHGQRQCSPGQQNAMTEFCDEMLGRALIQLHRPNEAIPLLEKSLAIQREGLPPGSLPTLETRINLAEAVFMAGDRARARKLMDEVRPLVVQVPPALGRFQEVEAGMQAAPP